MKKLKTILSLSLGFCVFYFIGPYINLSPLYKYIVLYLCAFGVFWTLEAVFITYKYIKDQKEDSKNLDYTLTQVNKELSNIDNKIKVAEDNRKDKNN
jgi:hypothetical protein